MLRIIVRGQHKFYCFNVLKNTHATAHKGNKNGRNKTLIFCYSQNYRTTFCSKYKIIKIVKYPLFFSLSLILPVLASALFHFSPSPLPFSLFLPVLFKNNRCIKKKLLGILDINSFFLFQPDHLEGHHAHTVASAPPRTHLQHITHSTHCNNLFLYHMVL